MKPQPIERIPIAEIRVVNPRSRNKITFRGIINNIGLVGLKKPITVFRRAMDDDGTQFDLVCGQGRMEAVAALGGSEIAAIITEASKKERYLMSLVENVARRQWIQEYELQTVKQRELLKRACLVHERLAILTSAMKRLLADARFVELLRGEGLDSMPEQLGTWL